MSKETESIIADGIKFITILFFKDLLNALFSPSSDCVDNQEVVDIVKEHSCEHC